MHQKLDDEVVFVCGADFLCAVGLQTCGSLRRRPDYSEGGHFQGAVASRL